MQTNLRRFCEVPKKDSPTLFQQMLVEEILDAGEEMATGVATKDAVVAIGVGLHFELDVCLRELFGKFGCILEMHVIVSQSVADEQVAMQLLEAMER